MTPFLQMLAALGLLLGVALVSSSIAVLFYVVTALCVIASLTSVALILWFPAQRERFGLFVARWKVKSDEDE